MSEREWQTFETLPKGVFDVLARYYDAGLNSFLIQRFCACVEVDGAVMWSAPFAFAAEQSFDLRKLGYRPIRWMPSPTAPADLIDIVPGPPDATIPSPIKEE